MSLSKSQQNLLVKLLNKTEDSSFSINTFKALKRRGLVNKNNLLTKSGRWRAIELIPLDEQCLHLSLDLKNITVESLSNPEFQSFKWFKNKGCEGAYCEGGAILTILKALALNKLVELNTFKSRGDACKRFLEAQFTILKENKNEIIESITLTTNKEFLDNFSEIISYTFIQEAYPGLTINFARKFLKAVERRFLVLVAVKFFESPYKYRKGWPDLTLVNNGRIKFVEVKTIDKLHKSQIQILNQFRPLLPVQFEVLKLTKNR